MKNKVNILEDIYVYETQSLLEEDIEYRTCVEHALRSLAIKILKEEYKIENTNFRVMLCDGCVRIIGGILNKRGDGFLDAVASPVTIVLRTEFTPYLFFHEIVHLKQFIERSKILFKRREEKEAHRKTRIMSRKYKRELINIMSECGGETFRIKNGTRKK